MPIINRFFLDFKNRLINGDSLKELKKIPDETFDLIFADPPYAMEGLDEIVKLIFEKNLLSEGGWLVLEHDRNWDFTAHEHFLKHKSYGNVHFSIFQN